MNVTRTSVMEKKIRQLVVACGPPFGLWHARRRSANAGVCSRNKGKRQSTLNVPHAKDVATVHPPSVCQSLSPSVSLYICLSLPHFRFRCLWSKPRRRLEFVFIPRNSYLPTPSCVRRIATTYRIINYLSGYRTLLVGNVLRIPIL